MTSVGPVIDFDVVNDSHQLSHIDLHLPLLSALGLSGYTRNGMSATEDQQSTIIINKHKHSKVQNTCLTDH